MGPKKGIFVVVNNLFIRDQMKEKELQFLENIFLHAEKREVFCKVHELVNRNRITQNHRRIYKESLHFRLRPFRFLLNKN
jgi:hypothetical protein